MHDLAEHVAPLLVNRKFDFLEPGSAVIGGMESGDLHRRTDIMKHACVENEFADLRMNGGRSMARHHCEVSVYFPIAESEVDAALTALSCAIAALSSARLVPSVRRVGSNPRSRNMRALIPAPVVRNRSW